MKTYIQPDNQRGMQMANISQKSASHWEETIGLLKIFKSPIRGKKTKHLDYCPACGRINLSDKYGNFECSCGNNY